MIYKFLLCFFLATVATGLDLKYKDRPRVPAPVQCEHGKYPPLESRRVPGFIKVDLDESPFTRWRNVVVPRKKQIANMVDAVVSLVERIPNGKFLIDLVDKSRLLLPTVPEPYQSEVRGIAQMTGISAGRIMLFGLFYDFFTVCTSVVAQDPNGNTYHGRNLDFGLFLGWDIANNTWLLTENLRQLVVNVEFTRNGQPLYYSTHLAGYVGILTAVKPGAFSLSIDDRFEMNGGFVGITEWLLGLRDQDWSPVITRGVFESDNTYQQAKDILINSKLVSPVYFILGGAQPGEGCVISRDRERTVDVWDMKSIPEHPWFVLETNYDHWKEPPFFDDRAHPGNQCMMELGQKNVGPSGLFNVLSTRPNLNKLTVYTAILEVQKGTMESYLQYCPDPCPLW